MKKLLFLLFGLLIISSCGSEEPISTSDKPETDDNINEVNEIKQSDIVGVWEKGNYFISFGNDGFYSAYIADKFIDSGNYTLSKGVVSCNNTYFNRNTTYTIKSLYDAKIEVNVTYTDVDGNNHNRAMTFAKTTAMPASQSNTLAGKTYTWNSSTFGKIIMTFSTYNSGIKSASKGSAAKYPLNFFYIYIGERLYYQLLKSNSGQVPTIGSWNTSYDDIICWKLHFSSNGSISDTEYITL